VEAEVDELWSFLRSKDQQRWLGWAVDHAMGEVLTDGLADHQNEALIALKRCWSHSELCNSTAMVGEPQNDTSHLYFTRLENAPLRRLSETI